MDNEYEFRQLFEEAPVGYHEINLQGIVQRVNRTECKLLGYPASELVGKHIWEFLVSDQQARAREAIVRKLAAEQELVPFEREYLRPDGTRVDVEIHENLILDEHGTVCGLRSALLDITEKKRLEREMRRSWKWFNHTLRSLGEGVIAADPLGKIVFMNPVAEDLLGITEADAAGRDILKVFRLEDDEDEPQRDWSIRRIVGEGVLKDWSGNLRLTCKSGEICSIQATVSAISDEASTVVGTVLIFRAIDGQINSVPLETATCNVGS
jgi:PAS domain S-box-containing protein